MIYIKDSDLNYITELKKVTPKKNRNSFEKIILIIKEKKKKQNLFYCNLSMFLIGV